MDRFLSAHRDVVIGAVSGFDRIRFRGTLRRIANDDGLRTLMSYLHILLVNFKDWAMDLSERIKVASLAVAESLSRPSIYLNSYRTSKEDLARQIAQRDQISQGLICVLRAVESCHSFHVCRDRAGKKLRLEPAERRCTHLYHYYMHPVFGFMHVRLQTWLPFNLHICINGREWLARQMDAAGIGYRQRDNCFPWVSDVPAAQALLDQQSQTDWPTLLGSLVPLAHPAHAGLFPSYPMDYYFSAEETEYATDVMFKNAASLQGLYPRLLRHGMLTLQSRDVLRFLGRKTPPTGFHGNFQAEVSSDLKERADGVRLKHRINANSIKMYDKQQSVLRVETTINNSREFKVYRTPEGAPADAQPKWLPMRKGVADLARRGRVSHAANERYLDAMADADNAARLGDLVEPLSRPVQYKGRRVRAINVMSPEDAALLKAVTRGEFAINGLRNRDLRKLLMAAPADARERKRQSARVSRWLRMLRAHGLIQKVARTHRYQLTAAGRATIALIIAAMEANATKLAA